MEFDWNRDGDWDDDSVNPQMVPGRLQNVVEMAVEGLYNFIVDILGSKRGPRYVPFLGTLFVYILAMNLFGATRRVEAVFAAGAGSAAGRSPRPGRRSR